MSALINFEIFVSLLLTCLTAHSTISQLYLFNILIAFLLCVATIWLKHWLQNYVKNALLASLFALLLMIGLVFIPVLFVCYRAFLGVKMINWTTLQSMFDQSKLALQNLAEKLPFIHDYLPSLLNEISFGKISGIVLKLSSIVGENGLKFIIDGFVIIVFLFVCVCVSVCAMCVSVPEEA